MTRFMDLSTLQAIQEASTGSVDLAALQTPGKRDCTYALLLERNELVCYELARFGVQPGSRVGLVVPERDAMCAAYLAVISVATAAPLSPNTTPDELEFYIRDFALDAVIVQKGMSELQQRAASAGVSVITLVPDTMIAGGIELRGDVIEHEPVVSFAEPDDVSVLFHTSGTTSRPKIVPRTHRFQLRKLGRDRGEGDLHPGDVVLNAMPLHHTQGLGNEFLTALLFGAAVAIVDFSPPDFLKHLETYRPMRFTLVPSMHRMVVDTLGPETKLPLDTGLRFVETSSAKLSDSLRKRIETVYGVPVVERYGATEVDTVVTVGLSREGVPEGSVGKRSHAGVVIMAEVGNVLLAGQRGEICVSTDHTIAGYENNSEANEAAFRDGYYHTGDEGYLDENEYLFVIGRVSESINRGGEKISPSEVDEVLIGHPEIEQAAAFAIPSESLGNEVWAAVVPRMGTAPSPTEIRSFAARSLSFPKVPKRIIIVTELPLNEIGKVMRVQLTRELGPGFQHSL